MKLGRVPTRYAYMWLSLIVRRCAMRAWVPPIWARRSVELWFGALLQGW
jgi:hypothetical protein